MTNWRPENWYRMIESPYMHDGVKLAKTNPEKALELELQHQAFRKGQEAGADAMLEALRKKGEESNGRSSHYLNDKSHRSGVWVFILDNGGVDDTVLRNG